jgi:hypothetical protein
MTAQVQDAPSVRTAINGSTVYAVFTRWGNFSPTAGGDAIFSNSHVVVSVCGAPASTDPR